MTVLLHYTPPKFYSLLLLLPGMPFQILFVYDFQDRAAPANPAMSNVFLLENTTSTGHRYSIHLAQTKQTH